MNFTAIIQEGENGWLVGQLEELPAVIEQGKTMEELKANLLSALQFYLQTQRELTQQDYAGQTVTREVLLVA